MFELTTISLVLFITTTFNIVASFISWQRRKTKVGFYFALGMLSVTFWTLAAGFDYASVPIPLKVFFAKLEYIGYNFAFVFFAFFALCYAGYENWLKDVRLRVFFVIVLVSNILLAWTNDWTGWLWISFTRSDIGENTVIFEHGPGEFWAAATGYLMVLIIIVPLWQAARHGSEFSRQQARLIFYATLLPVVGNLLYLFQPPQFKGVDWSSLSFSISSILCLLALYGTRFLDIVPIARDQLISSLSDGMIVLDLQNRIIDVNQAAASMMGVALSDLVGKNLLELTPLSSSYFDQPPDQEIRTELEVGNDSKRYFDVLLSPLRDDRKNILGRLIIFRDITARKENELRLLQLTQAVEQSPTSVMITDLNGNIVYVNPHFTVLTGYPQNEVIGQNPNIVQSGFTPDEVYREMWATIKSGGTWHGEFLNRKKNGDLYWEEAVIVPVVDQHGHTINYLAVKVDITQRKQIEDALRVNEKRFRQLVMSAPDAVFGVDGNGKIVFANYEACKLLGYADEELLGSNVEILVPPHLRGKHSGHRAGYFASPRTRIMGSGMELTAVRKDGGEVPVEITLSHSVTDAGSLVIAFMRDITERKQMDQALRNRTSVMEALNQVTLDLINRYEMNDILQTLLMRISSLLDAQDVSFDLVENNDTLVTYAVTSDQPLKKGDTMRRGEGGWLSWQAIDSGQSAVLEDYASWDKRRTLYDGHPIHAIMIIPVHQRDRVIGTINISRREANRPFTATDIYVAKQLAQMVALVLDNAQLYAQLQNELVESVRREAALHETQSQLVDQQRTLAVLEERQRMARDLHDSVNQSINGMVLFADTLAATLEKGDIERAHKIMSRLRESAQQSLRETRLMLYELQGSGPERSVDLIHDLEERLAMVEGRVGVRTQLIQEGSIESIPRGWHENLFWIAVEALNNSLKHAQARSVQIVVRCLPQRLELEMTDDGKGFDLRKVESGGWGLKNLRARADIIGGTLTIESEPTNGTTIRFYAEIRK